MSFDTSSMGPLPTSIGRSLADQVMIDLKKACAQYSRPEDILRTMQLLYGDPEAEKPKGLLVMDSSTAATVGSGDGHPVKAALGDVAKWVPGTERQELELAAENQRRQLEKLATLTPEALTAAAKAEAVKATPAPCIHCDRTKRELRSRLGDLIRRIGPARKPEDIKDRLEEIYNSIGTTTIVTPPVDPNRGRAAYEADRTRWGSIGWFAQTQAVRDLCNRITDAVIADLTKRRAE